MACDQLAPIICNPIDLMMGPSSVFVPYQSKIQLNEINSRSTARPIKIKIQAALKI